MPRLRFAFVMAPILMAGVASGDEVSQVSAPEERFLTLHSDGVALVRERRQVRLAAGRNRVRVPALPSQVDTTSVRVDAPGLDLVEVGDPVAVPASASPCGPHNEARSLARPPCRDASMEWVIEAERAMERSVWITYLTPAFRYGATLDVVIGSGGSAHLKGWIAIRNDTGIAYPDARVELVTAPARRPAPGSRPVVASVARRRVSLPDPVTLPAGERRRVRVLSRQVDLGPERIVVEGGRLNAGERSTDPTVWMSRREFPIGPTVAERRRRLPADDLERIRKALPPATRRIYENGQGVSLVIEEPVDPAEMEPDVPLGLAPGIRVVRRQLGFERDRNTGRVLETLEVRVSNDRQRSVQVEVVERMFRSPSFEIQGASQDLAVSAAGDAVSAKLDVAPGGTRKLTFSVHYRP